MKKFKRALQWVLSVVFVFAGVMHFVAPDIYVQIMPPYIPWHYAMVYLSGVAEIALGVMVAPAMPAKVQRLGAWGLIALLVAVFPANLHMALNQITEIKGAPAWLPPPTPLGLWLRLPFQVVFIAWAWWYTAPPTEAEAAT